MNCYYLKGFMKMKKITRKIVAAMSAAVLSAVPMINSFSANAAVTKYKTYVLYNVANNSSIAYFDFKLNYTADVTATTSEKTALCNNGYFSSSNITSSRTVLNTYNGAEIGATGKLCSTKFIVPMDTDSIYDVVSRSNVTIRNANDVTLSPTSIYMEEVLLGDVDLNGVVNDKDAELIIKSLSNPDAYKLNDKQKDAADVYNRGDGVTAMDALEIQKYVQGQVTHF